MMSQSQNSTLPVYTDVESKLLSSLLGVIGLFGFVTNFCSAIFICRISRFRNAFGVLTVFHALCDSGVNFVFLVWIVPNGFLNIPDVYHSINTKFGAFALFCQTGAFHAMFFISLNRSIAITFPMAYRQYFSTNNALILVAIGVLISAVYSGSFVFGTCELYFVSSNMELLFSNTICSNMMKFYMDFLYSVILFGIVFTLDLNTLFQMRRARKVFAKSSDSSSAKDEVHKRKLKEMILGIQACVSSAIYCIALINYHVILSFLTNPVTIFFFNEFSFNLAHAGGGIILLIFYPEIRYQFVDVPLGLCGSKRMMDRRKSLLPPVNTVSCRSSSILVKSEHI